MIINKMQIQAEHLFRASATAFALIVSISHSSGFAQGFTHADSGWAPIFNGKDWTGIYSRNWGGGQSKQHPPGAPWKILYAGTDSAVMRVTATDPGGNIGTDDTTFSHYRVRVEQKFDMLGGTLNGGLTYHTDESVSRMANNWPRSIEFQMQQKEPGAAYSIQQLTFTIRASGGRYAQSGGSIVQVCASGCNARSYVSNPVLKEAGPDGKPRWLRFELVARGSDTAYHYINDTLVFKLWNMRTYRAGDTPDGPVDHGGFGLQSEGAMIEYRHWEAMKFPPKTPMNENYLHRLFLDSPDSGVMLKAKSAYMVKWRTIGTTGQNGSIPAVKLQYAIGAGPWQSIADNVPNTGSYAWTVPDQATDQLRVKVSASDWVWADSSSGANSIGSISGALPRDIRPLDFSIAGRGVVLSSVQGFDIIRIHDAFGRRVREIPIQGNALEWDWKDSRGMIVQPGIYFIRATAAHGSRNSTTHVWKF